MCEGVPGQEKGQERVPFSTISFEEAVEKCRDFNERLKALQEQGATAEGQSELDIKFQQLFRESVQYNLQFTVGELMTLLGQALVDANEV